MESDDSVARYLYRSECLPDPISLTNESSNFEVATSTSSNSSNMEKKFIDDQFTMFCNKDNVDKAFAHLSQELNILGFPTFQQNGSSNLIQVYLINAAYELLQQNKQHLRTQEELENRNVKTACDIDYLHTNQIRLKNVLNQTEKNVALLQEKERQLVESNQSLQQKLKVEKEELKKLNLVHQQRDVQYQHETRKRERETNKLKERLNHLLSDKSQDRRLGMEILNNLTRKDGSRGTWKTSVQESKREEEMYKSLIKDYEQRHRVAIEESNILRHLLFKINDDLMAFIRILNRTKSYQHQDSEQTFCKNSGLEVVKEVPSVDDLDILTEGHFYMPIETLRNLVQDSFHLKFQYLHNHANKADSLTEVSTVSHENLGASNVHSLELYEDVFKKQRQLLEKILNIQRTNSESQNDKTDEFKEFIKEHELINRDWEILHEKYIPANDDDSSAVLKPLEQRLQSDQLILVKESSEDINKVEE